MFEDGDLAQIDPKTLPVGTETDRLVEQLVFDTRLEAVSRADHARAVRTMVSAQGPVGAPDGRVDGLRVSLQGRPLMEAIIVPEEVRQQINDGDPDAAMSWIWEHRYDQPWQQDLEAHVAAWWPTVMPYSTSQGWAWFALEAVLRKHEEGGWHYKMVGPLRGGHQIILRSPAPDGSEFQEHGRQTAPAPALAICRVVIEAELNVRAARAS